MHRVVDDDLLGRTQCKMIEVGARIEDELVVDDGDRIPAWLLVPHGASVNERCPAMVCLPGSSAPGKDTPAGLTASAHGAYAHELAERGYVCLALDYPLLHTSEYKTDPYALKYDSATMKGIVNHRRGVDLLRSLPYVDVEAIGKSLEGQSSGERLKEAVKRVRMTADDVKEMADRLRVIADVPDPVGAVTGRSERPDGLQVSRVRVPIGVIAPDHVVTPAPVVDYLVVNE